MDYNNNLSMKNNQELKQALVTLHETEQLAISVLEELQRQQTQIKEGRHKTAIVKAETSYAKQVLNKLKQWWRN